MTMAVVATPRVKGYLIEFLIILAINVPTVSFGLAMGWVSLVSGESGESGAGVAEGGAGEAALVGAAAATFAAGLAGVPLGARALRHGRKPALIATSALFVVCWALKLAGGWCVVGGRLAAGAAGAAAWCIVPLMAREMCSARVRGAAAAAPVVAHNLGVLLAFLAADRGLPHRTVEWCCLVLSAVHCGAFLLAPESPAFLAAQGKHQESRAALAWLRALPRAHPAVDAELRALPPPGLSSLADSPLLLVKEMLRSRSRRRALLISMVAVVGQESCGVLTVLQFAERVFVLARGPGDGPGDGAGEGPPSAARLALLLGVAQLVASVLALYLVERVGRRPLLVWCALATGAGLALGAGAARAGRGGAGGAGGALAAAVAADSLGLQPAPYAILGDMFSYQYRGCAVLLVTAAASLGNAAETLVFPAVTHAAGLWPALALASLLTLAYALFAIIFVPETRGRSPQEIYDLICPPKLDPENGDKSADDHPKYTPHTPSDAKICDKDTSATNSVQASNYNSREHERPDINNVVPKDVVEGKITTNVAACNLPDDTCRLDLKSTIDDQADRDTMSEAKSNEICEKTYDIAISKSTINSICNKVTGSTTDPASNERRDCNISASLLVTDANSVEASSDPSRKIDNVAMYSDVICSKTNCDVTCSSVVPSSLQTSQNNEQCSEETQCTNL